VIQSLKISVLQKNLATKISKDLKQKIQASKSDFLIIPGFFPSSKETETSILQNEKIYLDSILEISEYYKGVILGGNYLRESEGKLLESIPIVQDIQLIDWYDAEISSGVFSTKTQKGQTDKIFILGKTRFALASTNEILEEKNLQYFQKEKIEVVFNPTLNIHSEDSIYTKELEDFFKLSQKYNLNIFRICAFGELGKHNLQGRSFHSSPTGIKWKMASSENQMEIFKTLNVNIEGGILSFKG
jgi:hypothetical protein